MSQAVPVDGDVPGALSAVFLILVYGFGYDPTEGILADDLSGIVGCNGIGPQDSSILAYHLNQSRGVFPFFPAFVQSDEAVGMQFFG